jgi:RHS repeat-associated protein
MEGISTKAVGPIENRYKFNGIEKIGDLGLEDYDAKFRELDPQIGRWWQVDPKTESMEMWSPYTAMYNNPIRFADFLGDSSVPVMFQLREIDPDAGKDTRGLVTEATESQWSANWGAAFWKQVSYEVFDFFGISAADNYITDRITGKNDPVNVVLETANLGLALSKAKDGKAVPGGHPEIVIDPSKKIDRTLLDAPTEKGAAPTFKSDGTKVEIHHIDQNPNGPFVEMHWFDHCGKDNDKINHPNKGQATKIDRRAFNKAKGDYWSKEYFENL